MKLFIQNMVSLRCKLFVASELDRIGIRHGHVKLGEVEVFGKIPDEKLKALGEALSASGLELMEDEKVILIERIKNIITEMVQHSEEPIKMNFSEYLSSRLNQNYKHLSEAFSESTGNTIEQYILRHKVERVKELISYGKLNLSEIADKLHYSSVAHLSNQFKKITGLTPSFFKSMKIWNRTLLEQL